MTNEQPQQWVWITGANSGIGLELVRAHLAGGWHVIATSRSEGALHGMLEMQPRLHFLAWDVTDERLVAKVASQLQSFTPFLDRVILNAGSCEYLDMEQPKWALHGHMNQVNYLGMVNSVEACLPQLKIAPSAHLIGVGSQAVLAPFPKAEGYGASKAAVRYFLSSLRLDIAQYGIDVTCVLPGFVDTPLTQKNDFSMPFILSAEEAAKRIYRGVAKRPFELIFPKRLSWVLKFAQYFPKTWARLYATKPNSH